MAVSSATETTHANNAARSDRVKARESEHREQQQRAENVDERRVREELTRIGTRINVVA